MRKFGARNMHFYVQILIWKFDLTWTDPFKSHVGWRHRVKWLSPSILHARWPRKHAPHGMFVTYFIVTFCHLTLTLTFSSMPFVLMQYHLWTGCTLGDCGLFEAHLTDQGAQNVKTLHCDIWSDLGLKHDLNFKMLSMDWVHLDVSF